MRAAQDLQHLPRRATADLFSITPQGVGRWASAGCPRNSDGTYDLRAVIAWRIGKTASAPDGSELDALERWRSARAQREERRNAIERGDLMRTADVKAIFDILRDCLHAEATELINTIALDFALSGSAFGTLEKRRAEFLNSLNDRVKRIAAAHVPAQTGQKGEPT